MASPGNTYPRSRRLSGKLAFATVYAKGYRDRRGPLLIVSLPNDLEFPRLGLSVSRNVGTAPRRNRIKRMLRETFRHVQHDFPAGYDWIIVVRPHEPLIFADYQRLLSHLMVRCHSAWNERK